MSDLTIIDRIRTKNKLVLHLINSSTTEFLNRNLTSIGYNTFLATAVENGYYEAVEALLLKGANPDGITPDGYCLFSPISLASEIRNDQEMERVIDILLEYGANINGVNISQHSLLYNIVTSIDFSTFQKVSRIKYVLERGANPNGTKMFPVFNYVYEMSIENPEDEDIIRIIYLLLYFGANPGFKNVEGISVQSLIGAYEQNRFILNPYNEILEKCDNNILLQRIAKAFKIKLADKDLSNTRIRKSLCDCISYIQANFDKINFDDIKKRRKLTQPLCSNEYTIAQNEISEFTPEELIMYQTNKLTWCFHVSEIPLLLKTRKNPYTNEPLEKSFISELLKIDVFPEITFENAPSETYEMDLTDYESKNRYLINTLNDLIKSYSTYIDAANIQNYSIPFVSYTLYLLEPYLQVPSILYRTDNTLTLVQRTQIMINKLMEYLTMILVDNRVGIPLIGRIISQVNNDFTMVKDINNIAGDLIPENIYLVSYGQLNQLFPPDIMGQIHEILARDGMAIDTWNTIKYLFGNVFIRPVT